MIRSGLFRLGQRPALDGLRGLAVLAVVFTHFHAIPGGVVGVEALFTLSGFLITVLLIEEYEKHGRISLASFYRRRFRRVLPPLIALLTVGSLISVAIGFRAPLDMAKEAALVTMFLSNLQVPLGLPMPVFGHTWTLALEVQFYLIWPPLFTLLLNRKVSRGRILLLLIGLIAASAVWRIALFAQRPPSGPVRMDFLMRLFMGLDTHTDTLLLGCLTGALVAWNRLPAWIENRMRFWGCTSLVAIVFLGTWCHHEQYAFYCGLFTLTGLWVSLLITWLVVAPPIAVERIFAFSPLTALGRVSYALYLFHMPLCQWLHPQGFWATCGVMALSLVAAAASFHWLERPVVKARVTLQPLRVAA